MTEKTAELRFEIRRIAYRYGGKIAVETAEIFMRFMENSQLEELKNFYENLIKKKDTENSGDLKWK